MNKTSDKPSARMPIREYMTQAEAERERRRQAALSALQRDWLYKIASPEGKAKLVLERINIVR